MILEGKTLVVSGAGPGLGAEIARLALRDGANVMLAARREEVLQATAKELDPSGKRVAVQPTDITDAAQCQALADAAVQRFGGVDALAQVAALDAKFEVSGTVERWSGVAKARATQATPEERQRWCDMAATTLGAVAVVGGAKTRAAAALATAGATAHRAHAAPSAGAASSSSTGAARSSSAEPSDRR